MFKTMKSQLCLLAVLLVAVAIVTCINWKLENDRNKIVATNLEEAMKDENIDIDLGNYKESDDKVNIYLFRGKGCSHCEDFITFLATNASKTLGQYYNLVSFEVWRHPGNNKLKEKVKTYMDESEEGVPYIIIGEWTLLGYDKIFDSSIEEAIMVEYNKDPKDRIDIFKELDIKY